MATCITPRFTPGPRLCTIPRMATLEHQPAFPNVDRRRDHSRSGGSGHLDASFRSASRELISLESRQSGFSELLIWSNRDQRMPRPFSCFDRVATGGSLGTKKTTASAIHHAVFGPSFGGKIFFFFFPPREKNFFLFRARARRRKHRPRCTHPRFSGCACLIGRARSIRRQNVMDWDGGLCSTDFLTP